MQTPTPLDPGMPGAIHEEPAYIGSDFTCTVVGYTNDKVLLECPNIVNFVPQDSIATDVALGLGLLLLVSCFVLFFLFSNVFKNTVSN